MYIHIKQDLHVTIQQGDSDELRVGGEYEDKNRWVHNNNIDSS